MKHTEKKKKPTMPEKAVRKPEVFKQLAHHLQQHISLDSHQLVVSNFSSVSWNSYFFEANLSAFAEDSEFEIPAEGINISPPQLSTLNASQTEPYIS